MADSKHAWSGWMPADLSLLTLRPHDFWCLSRCISVSSGECRKGEGCEMGLLCYAHPYNFVKLHGQPGSTDDSEGAIALDRIY